MYNGLGHCKKYLMLKKIGSVLAPPKKDQTENAILILQFINYNRYASK